MLSFTRFVAIAFVAIAPQFLPTASGLLPTASAEVVAEYSAGHADIGIRRVDGELDLHYRFGSDAVLDNVVIGDGQPPGFELYLNPSEAYTRVPDQQGFDFSILPPSLGFTGVIDDSDPTTADLYLLPQGSVAGVPFLGFTAEDLVGEGYVGAASFSLIDVEFTAQGQGVADDAHFSLFSFDDFGNVTDVFMDTLDGIDPGDDVLPLSIGGHTHYTLGFTEEGLYRVTLEASAVHSLDGRQADREVFTFAVGSATTIPEPASLGLLTATGALAACRFRRKRKRSA
ncbi:MAG: PEP-CTERM sorting domain-containing protein [Planctomycetota bacterium]